MAAMFWLNAASEMPNAAAETALCTLLRGSEALRAAANRAARFYRFLA
jgi:hypothetical protein